MAAFVSDAFSYTPATNLSTHGSWLQIAGTSNISTDGGHVTPRYFSAAIKRYYNDAAVAPSADYAVRGVLNFDAADRNVQFIKTE